MSVGKIVKLNVGGTVFFTTQSTLKKFDGYFKTLIETKMDLDRDESGAIFIDRSPKHFEIILNFMRDGDVTLPSVLQDVNEIHREAQYYLLIGLMEMCETCQRLVPEGRKRCMLPHIDNDIQMFEIIANISKKPVLIVSYCITPEGLMYLPWQFNFDRFMMKYGTYFDVYFKAFKQINPEIPASKVWRYGIYDKSGLKFGQMGYLDRITDGIKKYLSGERKLSPTP